MSQRGEKMDEYYVVCQSCFSRNPFTNNFCNSCGSRLVKNSERLHKKGSFLEQKDEEDSSSEIHKQQTEKEQSLEANLTKFCPNCGTEITSGAKFCATCGLDLRSLEKNSSLNNYLNESRTMGNQQQGNINNKNKRMTYIASSIILAVFLIILGILGVQKYEVTQLPDGVDHADSVLKRTASGNTPTIDAVISNNPYLARSSNYIISVYKNDRTGRYVFPVQSTDSNKIHYCYITKIDDDHLTATDIDDAEWTCDIQKAGVQGDNSYTKDYEYNAIYYNDKIDSLVDF